MPEETEPGQDPITYVFRIAPPSDAPPPEKVVYVRTTEGKMVPRFFDEESDSEKKTD